MTASAKRPEPGACCTSGVCAVDIPRENLGVPPIVRPSSREAPRKRRRQRLKASNRLQLPGLDLMFAAFSGEQVEALVGGLAARAAKWAWYPVYLRWRNGEEVSMFHRRWLALSILYLHRQARGEGFCEDDVALARPWPRRAA